MNQFKPIEPEIANGIQQYLKNKFKEEKLDLLFPNVILRSDVLQILNNYCIVVYFPIQEESNNGFHINRIPAADGELFHFVYINTHQTIEKQVFTAAHELGHVWEVENYISKEYSITLDEITKEQIVNRFAAELLMPEDEFRKQFREIVSNAKTKMNIQEDQGLRITLIDFLKIVAQLMYRFLVPLKAVMARMLELHIMSRGTFDSLMLREEPTTSYNIQEIVDQIIREEGYVELYKPTDKKMIEGLADLLDLAEDEHSVSEQKIKHLRDKFELPSSGLKKMTDEKISYIKLESETNR